MTAPLKVGLLGFGYASATFHAPLIAAVPGLQLTAISSSRPQDVHAAWPEVTVCETPEQLIARPDLDLVVVATPNSTHAPLATQALMAGKHVVVDKPFTLTVHEAQDLMALACQQQRLLSVFHNRRWDGDFMSVQAALAGAELGRIVHFESHFDRYRPVVPQRWRDSGEPGSGLWFDLGPHLLDQALELFGLPQALSLDRAQQRDNSRADDWFHAVLHYDALRVVLHASALTAHVPPRFTVHGTRGSLVKWGLDTQETALKAGLRPPHANWGMDPNPLQLTLAADDLSLTQRTSACLPGDYTRYYAGIRDAVQRGSPNPVPPEEALQVMELIELGLVSAQEGRRMDVPSKI